MAAIKQINDYSCAPACLESIASELGVDGCTQTEIIERFPDLCKKGQPQEGAIELDLDNPIVLEHIVVELGLAKCVEVAPDPVPALAAGDFVLFVTTVKPGGAEKLHHCMRLLWIGTGIYANQKVLCARVMDPKTGVVAVVDALAYEPKFLCLRQHS